MTIGEKISILRRQKGMSQKQLAEQLMISPQAVSRWEQDENLPDLDNILRLSNIFDVSTDYLLKNGEFTTADATPKNEDEESKRGFTFSINLDDDEDDDDDYDDKYDEDGKPRHFIISNIYNIATVAFLIIGFGWGYWHPGWAVFVAAWLIRTIASPRSSISFNSLGVLVFLAAGFVWGAWNVAWIAFPIAWLMNSLIRDYRRGKEYKNRQR